MDGNVQTGTEWTPTRTQVILKVSLERKVYQEQLKEARILRAKQIHWK